MSKLTKEDLNKLIRDAVGDELAELREASIEKGAKAEEARAKALSDAGSGEEKSSEPATFGGVLRHLVAANGNVDRAKDNAHKAGEASVAKALAASELAAGGVLLTPEMSAEVIPELNARAVVRARGADVVDMPTGSMSMPFEDSGPTANYVGENEAAPTSQPSYGVHQLNARKLVTMIPASNELLRGNNSMDGRIRRQAAIKMALREDIAFIRGDGNNGTPKGMLNWADPANKFTSNGTDLDGVTLDLTRAAELVDTTDVPMVNPGWLLGKRSKWALMRIRTADGQYAFLDEMRGGTLFGYAFSDTSQIPQNLGAGNESEVYFADFGSLIIAQTEGIIVSVSSEAAYSVGSQQVSAFQNDQTLIRLIAQHDFMAGYRGKEISVIQGVTWGA